MTNQKLMSNPTTKQWVWLTTIRLQEALRDYVVGRIRDRSLPSLTEPELRQAAFNSHPQAYDRGGLATVVLVAPELIPIIATIPGAEFNPTAENFGPTVRQVFVTLALVSSKVAGAALATTAGPAHTRIFRWAVHQDQQRFLNQLAIARELSNLKVLINGGELDHIPWLDEIIARLNAREFPDQGFAQLAREVVQIAQNRRHRLVQNYNTLMNQSPEVRSRVGRAFPGILGPAGN